MLLRAAAQQSFAMSRDRCRGSNGGNGFLENADARLSTNQRASILMH
jgi:hypothetical protein